jgi:hypothetical protein
MVAKTKAVTVPRGPRPITDKEKDVSGCTGHQGVTLRARQPLTTMSHRRTDSAGSTCTVLTCTSDEFWDLYDNDNLSTVELARDVLNNAVHPRRTRLRQSDTRFRLDDLLVGMLQQAPDPCGQRYVAVALHIAHEKGTDAVIDVAKAWLDYLFLPSPCLHLPPLLATLIYFHSACYCPGFQD